jgi:hypothetical protein
MVNFIVAWTRLMSTLFELVDGLWAVKFSIILKERAHASYGRPDLRHDGLRAQHG